VETDTEIWCITLDKVCSLLTYALKIFHTRKMRLWVRASAWLGTRFVAFLYRSEYRNELKQARTKVGTE
jgi:hypothetical protein